jgi:hypothetical protein
VAPAFQLARVRVTRNSGYTGKAEQRFWQGHADHTISWRLKRG